MAGVTEAYTYLDHMRQYKRDWMRRHRAKLKQRREAAKASWAKPRAPRNPHGYNGIRKRSLTEPFYGASVPTDDRILGDEPCATLPSWPCSRP